MELDLEIWENALELILQSDNGRDHGVALIDFPFEITRYATPVHRMVRTISELILHKSRPPW